MYSKFVYFDVLISDGSTKRMMINIDHIVNVYEIIGTDETKIYTDDGRACIAKGQFDWVTLTIQNHEEPR